MAYLTRVGSIWGQVPATTGNVYWVAPADTYTADGRAYTSSDDNDGLSPERALRTLGEAITLATAAAATVAGDTIVLLPGDHTITAQATLSKAGVTLMGIRGSGHPQR